MRHIVCKVAHVAAPPVSMVEECHIRIDICPTTSTPGDDLIVDDGDGRLILVERGVYADTKSVYGEIIGIVL